MDILIGLFFIALGVIVMKYRYQIYHFTGDWDWAIKYLGGNGTILAIVLIGMGLIGMGAAWPFGVFEKGEGKLSPNTTQNTNIINQR